MKRFGFSFLVLALTIVVGLSSSFAQEEAAAVSSTSDLAAAQSKALDQKVQETVKNLTIDEARHFFVVYSNYTVYSMVNAVRDDVDNAVSECATNNPIMADELNDRFSLWEENVGASMDEALLNLDNMTMAQNYLPQSEFQVIFELLKEVRAVDSSQFEKIPLTSPEACKFMLSKMGETEGSMMQLLQITLVSYPTVLQKTQK